MFQGYPAARLNRQRGGQARADVGVRQTDQRSLVEVVQNLAHQPGLGDGNGHHVGVEIALFEQGINHLAQVILGCFDGQKNGPGLGPGKSRRLSHHRPEQADCLQGQPIEGQDVHRARPGQTGIAQQRPIGAGQGQLRHQHQDAVAGYLVDQ
jgi:hypothetical protein